VGPVAGAQVVVLQQVAPLLREMHGEAAAMVLWWLVA